MIEKYLFINIDNEKMNKTNILQYFLFIFGVNLFLITLFILNENLWFTNNFGYLAISLDIIIGLIFLIRGLIIVKSKNLRKIHYFYQVLSIILLTIIMYFIMVVFIMILEPPIQ